MIVGDIICSGRPADYVDADGSVMLLCDGRVVLPATYPVLVALIGAAFGAAGQIPNFGLSGGMNGRSPMGASAAGGHPLGQALGAENHLHTDAAFSMTHAYNGGAVNTDPGGGNLFGVGGTFVAPAGHTHPLPSLAAVVHGAQPNTDNADGRPPMLACYFFIKAA
jgi:microcystin-dependent protein